VYKILINTADRYNRSVTLYKDDNVVDEVSGEIDIVNEIKNILEKNKIKVSECVYKANPGPGSFTGLKIGVTIANILNWATGKTKIGEQQMPEYGSEPNIHKTKWVEK